LKLAVLLQLNLQLLLLQNILADRYMVALYVGLELNFTLLLRLLHLLVKLTLLLFAHLLQKLDQ